MTKFLKYINEGYGSSRVTEISEFEIKNLIKNNCKKSVNQSVWRGTRYFDNDFGYGEASESKFERTSANTLNYYTLIIDNHPSWKKYPKRSKSFVCSTTQSYASGYGSLFRVIPFDNVEVGICPAEDMWSSFKKITALGQYMWQLQSLFDITPDIDTTNLQNDYKKLIKSLNKLGSFLRNQNEKELKELSNIIPWEYYKYTNNFKWNVTFSDYIIAILNPKNNNFKLQKAGNMNVSGEKEVWFSGPSVFINYRMYQIISDIYKGNILKWAESEDLITKPVMET